MHFVLSKGQTDKGASTGAFASVCALRPFVCFVRSFVRWSVSRRVWLVGRSVGRSVYLVCCLFVCLLSVLVGRFSRLDLVRCGWVGLG